VGAIEHLKTLCCLGLPPESTMVAVTPLLHEIIPHGWTRMCLVEPDASIGSIYAENPSTAAHYRERFCPFMDDPSSPMALWLPSIQAVGIGWTLHMQGRGWLESGWYKEIEAPLDACWILDAMIGDNGRTIAHITLTRPRSARPFTVDEVRRFDPLRPWLAHAFRLAPSVNAAPEDQDSLGTAGAPVLSGEMNLTADGKVIFQTAGLEHLLLILAGEPGNYTRYVPARSRLPAPILTLLQRIVGAANGGAGEPPRMQASTAYGVLTLEAKWLLPAGALPADAAKDPKSCLISLTIELREHAIAHAARVLRRIGATPAQVKVGVPLALGRGKPEIADQLGIKVSTVKDQTEKLYQTLDVHNAAELGARIWIGEKQDDAPSGRQQNARADLFLSLRILQTQKLPAMRRSITAEATLDSNCTKKSLDLTRWKRKTPSCAL
jgi:DNA-binding CsgD family transcriptional regulator